MHLSTEEKQAIFEKYGQGKNDTGSPESQIALFSVRIKHLTEHLKENHKDYATARALKMLVGQRRSLLDYLVRKDINRYRAIIAKKELGIRKLNRGLLRHKRDKKGVLPRGRLFSSFSIVAAETPGCPARPGFFHSCLC